MNSLKHELEEALFGCTQKTSVLYAFVHQYAQTSLYSDFLSRKTLTEQKSERNFRD